VNKHGLPASEAQEWFSLAEKWRMPYWDWARKQNYTEDFAYPQVLTQGTVRIYPPAVVKEFYPPNGLYTNPLWGFENPELDENGDPRAFGNMPPGKTDWNIKDNPTTPHPKPPTPDDDNPWMPWSQTSGTSRYGVFVSKDGERFRGLEGVNNPWTANSILSTMETQWYTSQIAKDKGIRWNPGTLADAVNRMFSPRYNATWGQFASTKWTLEGTNTGYLSLEYIHNNVHNITGGGNYATGVGHMSDVPVAAFDPIFWLHHCQIDRLLAIWQSLYWDLWWDQREPGGDHVRDDDPDDFLQPFHTKDNGDLTKDVWTATKCKDWTKLNYHYDDLMLLTKNALLPDGTLDEEKYKMDLHLYINNVYPSTKALVQAIRNSDVPTPEGLAPDTSNADERNEEWKDYIINVVYDRYALDGRAYTIEFYLGGPPGKPETHFARENYVGQVYTFGGGARNLEASCSNCKTQAEKGILSCGQVPLTIQLLHHSLDDVHEHSIKDFNGVEEYLTKNLSWRFVQLGGGEVNPSKFSETRVQVLRGVGKPRSVEATPALTHALRVANLAPTAREPADYALTPVYGDYEPLPEVTRGKPWGLESGDLISGTYTQG
jgi:tyrosinase